MLKFLNKGLTLLTILILMNGFLMGCELTDDEKKAIDDGLADPPQHETPDLVYPDKPYCFNEKHIQPPAEISKKIDVLFVVDSSGSLRGERDSIGDGIDAFLQALPVDVDAQVGVMLAHAGARTGALYRYDSNQPYVLNSSQMTSEDLRSVLRNRMKNVASESATDGGEVGLYSLSRAFDEDKLALSQEQGFFRNDAALAVVFVADENDICARYPDGITPVPDPNGKEIPAFNNYCTDVTPESVLEKAQSFKSGMPLLVSGIVYNGDSQFPDQGENEIGYGYLEMIQMANGVAIDLAGGQYHQGLDQIGTLATKKLNLHTDFALERNDFDPDTLKVFVDGTGAEYTYEPNVNQVNLTGYAGIENSEVVIAYCLPEPEAPATPAIISNLRFLEITSISATLAWDTDQDTDAQLEVTNPATGEVIYSAHTVTPSTQHLITISGLNANTLYHVRAISTNADGLVTLSDPPLSFQTRRGGGFEF